EKARQQNGGERGPAQRGDHIVERDTAQHAEEHDRRDDDDGDAERNPDTVPADPSVNESLGRAQRADHLPPLGRGASLVARFRSSPNLAARPTRTSESKDTSNSMILVPL